MSQPLHHVDREGRHFTADLWHKIPWRAIRDNPGLGFVKQWNGYDWGGWFVTRATSGNATMISEYPGTLQVTAGAAADAQGVTAANPIQYVNIAGTLTSVATGAAVTPAAGRIIALECLVEQNLQTSTLGASWFGLATIAQGLSSAGAPAGTDRIGFLAKNAASVLFNYKDAGASEYEQDTTFDYTTAQYVKLGFVIDGLRSVTPYINGRQTSLGTIAATTTLALPDALMTVSLANVANGGTGTPTSDFQWIRLGVYDEATDVVTIS